MTVKKISKLEFFKFNKIKCIYYVVLFSNRHINFGEVMQNPLLMAFPF